MSLFKLPNPSHIHHFLLDSISSIMRLDGCNQRWHASQKDLQKLSTTLFSKTTCFPALFLESEFQRGGSALCVENWGQVVANQIIILMAWCSESFAMLAQFSIDIKSIVMKAALRSAPVRRQASPWNVLHPELCIGSSSRNWSLGVFGSDLLLINSSSR